MLDTFKYYNELYIRDLVDNGCICGGHLPKQKELRACTMYLQCKIGIAPRHTAGLV